ncbi:MAG: MBL fold metallo-hydrolase [Treponema sp.]|nr:MBL fold metallo-hydrolase [Treponema sp.]
MMITILGSGTSQGVPVIGCGCPVCTSSDSRDKRFRCSLYVEGSDGERAVIDTGPEFRLQALQARMKSLDAVFLTHAHADHIHGLDDIRQISWGKPIPVYGNKLTIEEFKERFSYIFKNTQLGGGKPHVNPIIVKGPVQLGKLTFIPLPVKHGNIDILGWKINETTINTAPGQTSAKGGVVYLTDCSHIDEDTFSQIAEGGTQHKLSTPLTAIIGGLRIRPHKTHFSFEEAINAGVRMKAKRIYLTHICHDYSHQEIEEYCRNFAIKQGLSIAVAPAYDGLELEI